MASNGNDDPTVTSSDSQGLENKGDGDSNIATPTISKTNGLEKPLENVPLTDATGDATCKGPCLTEDDKTAKDGSSVVKPEDPVQSTNLTKTDDGKLAVSVSDAGPPPAEEKITNEKSSNPETKTPVESKEPLPVTSNISPVASNSESAVATPKNTDPKISENVTSPAVEKSNLEQTAPEPPKPSESLPVSTTKEPNFWVSTAPSTITQASSTPQTLKSLPKTPVSSTTKATPPIATVAPMPKSTTPTSNSGAAKKHTISVKNVDENAPPQKKPKPGGQASSKSSNSGGSGVSSSAASPGGKSPQEILMYMDKTFEQRRRIITKQMPTIPELQKLYPPLFMHKQLLTEFQRITKIDIDQKIQEFCVRFATAVIGMAKGKKEAAPVIERWEKAQKENKTLKQYWDMMTALCLLPLHFDEQFSEMVQEIGEDEEVVPEGKIVPVLVARGNIFRTDEFFLIAENTIVQEFEEFTIALASLYSSYWVFNMVYPESVDNTYNYIQRCIVRQKEPGAVPTVCRNFTKALQKWNKDKDGK